MRKKWLFMAPAALLGIAVFIFMGGEIVKLLWNWLLPPLFGCRELTFWQALGLLALCRILFGHHGVSRYRFRRRMRERMAERMAIMTPEERERFRQRIRERCGFGTPPSKGQ